MKYTNDTNISLPLAVWLAHDEYEYNSNDNTVSATALLKSTRQLILASRLKEGDCPQDISSLFASKMGTALHSAIENSWLTNYRQSMIDLGYPMGITDSVRVNPEQSDEDAIEVRLELRTERSIGNWVITGCADMICDGAVHDFKSTKVNTFIKGNKDDDYIKQLSIYRWLNPTLICEDRGFIEFLFTDWSLISSYHVSGYPQAPVVQHPVQLMSLDSTELFIQNKLNELTHYAGASEPELPLCNDKELWRNPPVYQYFSNPANKKATKNFDTQLEANSYMLQKGKGEVRIKLGQAMACLWCNARTACSQYSSLLAQGLIVHK